MNPIALYLSKQKLKIPFFESPPDQDLEFIVVIPCYHEPDLERCLTSLETAARKAVAKIEIIIIINAPDDSTLEVKTQNRIMFSWLIRRTHHVPVYFVLLNDIPARQAGVGYARKMGMDEAIRRFGRINRAQGIICSMDADSWVDPNYFIAIRQSQQGIGWECMVIHYEHDWSDIPDPIHIRAIISYELHLRYYEVALRFSGFPHAFQTLGSSMAVRAMAYVQVGGMPARQAGEDFYFIHKFSRRNTVVRLGNTTVYPSARISDRVPFGTGKALSDLMANSGPEFNTYAWQNFIGLKSFLDKMDDLFLASGLDYLTLSPGITAFLQHIQFAQRLKEIKEHTASPATFRKRFFHVMDAFMMMKYMHYTRDHFYKNIPLVQACNDLLKNMDPHHQTISEESILLEMFRKMDRQASEIL